MRPLPIFGSGEQTRTLTHVDDIADGIVTAMAHPAALNEDFNISASEELTVAADRAPVLGGVPATTPTSSSSSTCPSFEVDVQRRWPSVEKAERAARLAGARSACARASRRPRTGCASRKEATA